MTKIQSKVGLGLDDYVLFFLKVIQLLNNLT